MRNRPADIGRARGRELDQRIGRELRLARVSRGYTQREVARRAGISQSMLSKIERGEAHASLDVLARVAAACDHELAIRVYPVAGRGLRDSPQLALAHEITRQTHPAWHASSEVPVGDRYGSAADLLLEHPQEAVHMEIESGIVDFQAQFRPAQLKRDALSQRLGRPVRLIIAVNDTESVRARLVPHADFVRRMLPATSRQIWRCLRDGTPIGADGILFVRLPAGKGNPKRKR